MSAARTSSTTSVPPIERRSGVASDDAHQSYHKFKEAQIMSLKLVETSLNHVAVEYQSLYAKKPDGTFMLDVSDLNSHVDAKLKPLRSELEVVHAHERKSVLEHGFGAALRKANLLPQHEQIVMQKFGGRVELATVGDQRVARIKDADGSGMLFGSGPGGAATLDDLAKEVAKEFPFLFAKDGEMLPTAEKTDLTLTRSEFFALTPKEQREKIMIEKYRIVDDPPPPKYQPRPGEKVLTREQFDALNPIERAGKMRDGYTLVN
jgi:hypothetical protein